MKKMCVVLATIVAMNTINCFTANAAIDSVKNQMVNKLVEAGYYEETAEALSDSELKDVYKSIVEDKEVSITTCATEVDNLSEIESFLSHTEDELIELGADKIAVKENQKYLDKLFEKTDSEIMKEYNIDKVEAKLLREAKENAEKTS